MFQNRDTIAAQATAAGEGGVAIVRVSGADCEAVVSRVFRAKNGKPLRQMLDLSLRAFAKDKQNRGVNAYADVNSYD